MANSFPPPVVRSGMPEYAGVVVGILAAWVVSGWLALAIGVGCTVAIAEYVVRRLQREHHMRIGPARRCSMIAGSVWALTIVAAIATVSLVAALVLLLLGATTLVLAKPARAGEEDPLARLPWSDLDALDAAIRGATDEELAALWRRSASAIRHSYLPASISRYQSVRQIVLAEAERRDPDRVARWLAEEPNSDRLHLDSS